VDLHVSLEGRRDLSGQVYRQVRQAILEGRLRAGQAVPSTRELAGRLAVSRNTVSLAYDRLVAEGFLATRAGVGTWVQATQWRAMRQPRDGSDSPLRPRPLWDHIPMPPDMSARRPMFDFRAGIPDVQSFPFDVWRALVSRQLRVGAVGTGSHIDAAGHHGLRTALARHVSVSRAVRAAPEEVFVTNGSQQAFDLICRVLVEPGEVVAVEDPGYPSARLVFAIHGARVAGVPVDQEGLVVEAIPDETRLIYVCPSHHYPLGVSMSLPRRLALLEWADRVDGVIVEDDYDSEFRYGGRPLEPLQSLGGSSRVLYVGSLSKVMLPTLRLGFLIAPAPLHAALRKAKHLTDWHTTVPLQAAAAEFIDQGLLARHVRRARAVYAERHRLITAALESDLADGLALIPSAAGLHLAALLVAGAPHNGGDGAKAADVALARRALSAGVAVTPLSRCAVGSPTGWVGLMIGYGAIPTDRIDEGLRRLRECLEDRGR
jgi:GntR family transcriptional regulator/MocR family aminotransferase